MLLAAWVMQFICEQDFLGFSYRGCSGRDAHRALDALCVSVTKKKVNWILDAEVQKFCDNVDHLWLMKLAACRLESG